MNNESVVELHVDDFTPILAYYQRMGFEVVWERKPEGEKGYLVLRLRNNVLCFWAGNQTVYNQAYFGRFPSTTVRGYGVEVVIMVDDIDSYYQAVREVANVVEDICLRPWGLRDFRAVDPAGFYLRFTEPYDVTDPAFAVT